MLNVSTQSSTRGPPTFTFGLDSNHERNVRVANFGTFRCGAMPPSHLNAGDSSGACPTKFASRGMREAIRAHQWISPIAYACRGRSLRA